MQKPFFAFLPLAGILLFFAEAQAQTPTCPRWEPVGNVFCDTLNPPKVSGQTDGEDYLVNSTIAEAFTRQNGRDLKPGEKNIVVDKHGICRYLSYIKNEVDPNNAYFVPFSTKPEWSAFINNSPDEVMDEACAPEIGTSISTVCGDMLANRARGKLGDQQEVLFSFLRARNWVYLTPDGKGNCVSSGQNAKTTCAVNLSAMAQAVPTTASETAPRSEWTAAWQETGVNGATDCTPQPPDCKGCMEMDGCATGEALTIMTYALPVRQNTCSSWAVDRCVPTCQGQTGVAAGATCKYYTSFSRFDAGSGGAWNNIRRAGATGYGIGTNNWDRCSGGGEDGLACWPTILRAALTPTTFPCGATCTPKTIFPAIPNACSDGLIDSYAPSTCTGLAATPGSRCIIHKDCFRFDADSPGAWRNITNAGYVGRSIGKKRAPPAACTGGSWENGLACRTESFPTTTTLDPALCKTP